MASSSARHLFLLAFLAFLAAADAWGGGRLFFGKNARAEPAAEPEKAAAAVAAAANVVPDTNSAPAFSRAASTGRGYGLYGRPEEESYYPHGYFRRGVHRNAEKLTTTATDVPTTTRAEEEPAAATAGVARESAGTVPAEDNGSGRGRPPWYYAYADSSRGGGRQEDEEEWRRDYGMSDTRLYQNGRYYYDVDKGRYGYGREMNPVRTRPADFGSGYGRRGRYYGDADAAAAGYRQYGNGGDRSFQEEGRRFP